MAESVALDVGSTGSGFESWFGHNPNCLPLSFSLRVVDSVSSPLDEMNH